nr:1227_t:CDS:2 [Entrophospora candida]
MTYRSFWKDRVKTLQSIIPNAQNHNTSPLVYEGCKSNDYKFIGGYSDFSKLVESRHKLDNVSTSSSLNIKDDVNGCEDGTLISNTFKGKLLDLASSNTDLLNPASRNYRHLIKSQLSLSKIINVYFDSIPYEITKEGRDTCFFHPNNFFLTMSHSTNANIPTQQLPTDELEDNNDDDTITDVSEIEEDWEELVEQLEQILFTLVLPLLGRWLGRKLSFWAWTRFINWYYQPSSLSLTDKVVSIQNLAFT